MPIPAIIGALAAAIPSVVRLATGGAQKTAGLAKMTAPRPEYERPEEVREIEALAREGYNDPFMPGQGLAMDMANQAGANAFAQAKETGSPLSLVTAIQANTNNTMRDVMARSAQFRQTREQQLINALSQSAGFTDQEYQMNEFAPYAQKQQEGRDMFGAGMVNTDRGLTGLSQNFLTLMSNSFDPSNMGKTEMDQTALDAAYSDFAGIGVNNAAGDANTAAGIVNSLMNTTQGGSGNLSSFDAQTTTSILDALLNAQIQ